MSDPERIAHFRLTGRLGAGGMGVVYRARDEKLDRDVALKVIAAAYADDPEWRRRLAKEAKAAAAVRHPGVPAVYEIGEDGDTLYIAMELLAGTSLRAALPLDVSEALRVAADVADTLAKAHEVGIVHRDIKPENVFLTEEGAVKVLDFGIARRGVDASAPTLAGGAGAGETAASREGTVVGTPGYMSPEQASGTTVGPASDLFSLGVLLFEALSGKLPFVGRGLIESAAAVLRDEPAPLDAPGLPPEVGVWVLRCLAKDPGARPGSARELASRLRELRARLDSAASAETATAAAPLVPRPAGKRDRAVEPAAVRGAFGGYWARAGIAIGAALAGGAIWAGARMAGGPAPGAAPSTTDAPAASASAEAPSPRAVKITDLPITGTTRPEAKAAYEKALADFRRADWSRAGQHLEEALAKDPDFALAVLRMAFFEGVNNDLPSARKHFQWLADHQSELDERHRAWQRGVEVIVLRDPSDYREAGRLFEEASARWPEDVELHHMVAATYSHSNADQAKALAEARRAVELDPEYADALQALAALTAREGRTEEAARYLDRCVAAPSTDCVFDRMRLALYEGRCDDAITDAKLYASRGGGSNLHWLFAASAALSRGDGDAAAESFEKRGDELEDPRSRWVMKAARLRKLALRGRFEELGREVDARWRETTRSDLLGDVALLGLEAARERGDDRAIEALAERFLGGRLASDGGYRQLPTADPSPLFWRELGRLEKLRTGTLEEKLAEWRANERKVGFDEGRIWFQATARIADSEEARRAALAARPAGFSVLDVRDATLGWDVLAGLELAAGNVDAARELYGKAAQSCTALLHPFEYVRAQAGLGAALEAAKDKPGACAAYRKVLGFWGDAKRSATASRANARLAALGCDKP